MDLVTRQIKVEFGSGGLPGSGWPFVSDKNIFSIGVKHPTTAYCGVSASVFDVLLTWPVGTDLTGATPLIMDTSNGGIYPVDTSMPVPGGVIPKL